MANERRFTVREEHIKLIKRMYVGWQNCEFGAPDIDPKRPYGNSSVYLDIAEILDIKPATSCEHAQEFSAEQEEHMWELHRGTETALQILCALGGIEPGDYIQSDGRGKNWRRA